MSYILHSFCRDGIRYVVDGGSGSIHIFDEAAWQVLEALPGPVSSLTDAAKKDLEQQFPNLPVREILTELEGLENSGQLFHPGYRKEAAELSKLPTYPKAMCLNISHDCNLRCRYCFAGKGSYDGERMNMSSEVARQAIDFLLEASGPKKSVEVDFFGGEPLLNIAVLKDTIEYGRQQAAHMGKEISFTVTTNGVLLTPELAAYLNEEMYNIVLSLDGRQEINDRMRLTVSGKGSAYELVVNKMLELARMRGDKQYYVRGTYTRDNLDFAQDVLHLADLGFKNISVEPVVADPEEPYSLREEDLPVLLEQYDILTDAYLEAIRAGRPFNFFHFNLNLDSSPCLAKRVAGCGAGHEYLAVIPNGDIYPCHQFVGREQYRLGNVNSGIERRDLVEMFKAANVFTKSECESCWAQLFCSGGCHANNEKMMGSIEIPDPVSCELMRKRLECAIAVQVALLDREI